MDEKERAIKITELEIHDNPDEDRRDFEERVEPEHHEKLTKYGEDAAFIEYLEAYSQGRILDIACGYAQWASHLFENGYDGEYYGVDISKNRIKSAHDRLKHEPTGFFRGDAEMLPFPDSTFETIICSSALHHFPNWNEQALNEIQRVLEPGGNMVFREPLKYNPLAVAYRRLFPMQTHTPYEQPFNPFELKRELENRFESVDWKGQYLLAPAVPFLDNQLPVSIPFEFTKALYNAERRVIDMTTVLFCHHVTGVALNSKR